MKKLHRHNHFAKVTFITCAIFALSFGTWFNFAKPNSRVANAATMPTVGAPNITVSTESDLITAIASAPAGSQYVIAVNGTIELTATLQIPAGDDIALTGGGVLSGSGNFGDITVNGSLLLANITVTHDSNSNIGRGVLVNLSTSTLDMLDGANITNNNGSSGAGVFDSGTFNMWGGIISNNSTATGSGGGVVITNGGTFNMTGDASITGNSSGNSGAGVYMDNTGGTANSVFNMNSNASITNNSNTGTIGTAGVRIAAGIFNMSGGIISNNVSPYDAGGIGNSGTTTISGTAVVSGNSAGTIGGGIENKATGTLIINGGTISGNTAGTYGGGIYNAQGGTVTITSGTISGNIATTDGGGIYTQDYTALTVSAGVVFANNSAATFSRMSPSDQTLYDAQIAATSFSLPIPFNGYNNYDINYNSDLPTDICPYNSSLWKDDTNCVEPTEPTPPVIPGAPNTGVRFVIK